LYQGPIQEGGKEFRRSGEGGDANSHLLKEKEKRGREEKNLGLKAILGRGVTRKGSFDCHKGRGRKKKLQ